MFPVPKTDNLGGRGDYLGSKEYWIDLEGVTAVVSSIWANLSTAAWLFFSSNLCEKL